MADIVVFVSFLGFAGARIFFDLKAAISYFIFVYVACSNVVPELSSGISIPAVRSEGACECRLSTSLVSQTGEIVSLTRFGLSITLWMVGCGVKVFISSRLLPV